MIQNLEKKKKNENDQDLYKNCRKKLWVTMLPISYSQPFNRLPFQCHMHSSPDHQLSNSALIKVSISRLPTISSNA